MKTKETKTTEFNAEQFITACGSKSSAIRKLLAKGHTRGEVAKMLNIRYQHVRNVEITPIKKESSRIYKETKRTLSEKELDAEYKGL